MNLRLSKKEKLSIVIVGIAFLFIAIVGWFLLGEIILGILIALGVTLLLSIQIELYRRVDQMQQKMHLASQNGYGQIYGAMQDNDKQLESLISLLPALKLNAPLPNTRGWAASPDFLKIVATLICDRQPKVILELGSGVSTIVAGYCLKNIGEGAIISIDHEPEYAIISQQNIVKHQLQDIARVVCAALKETEIKGEKKLWYDLEKLNEISGIDMLIIDGPPGGLQKMSRYPALPLLRDRLNENSIIILDDGNRPDEKKAVELWVKEFGLTAQKLTAEKGAYILWKADSNSTIHHTITDAEPKITPDSLGKSEP